MPRLFKSSVKLALLIGVLHGLETLITLAVGRYVQLPVWILFPAVIISGGLLGAWLGTRKNKSIVEILPEKPTDGTFLDSAGQIVSFRKDES